MMEAPLGNSINSVAVTYNPDTDLLAQVLESAAPQVQGVVVVRQWFGECWNREGCGIRRSDACHCQ
jgi:hypothetical protein